MYKKYDNLYRKYWGGVTPPLKIYWGGGSPPPLPPCSCATIVPYFFTV